MALDITSSKPGLSVGITTGRVLIAGTSYSLPTADVPLARHATNYVYLDLATRTFCASTAFFPANSMPIAIVETDDQDRVRNISDQRPDILVSVG